MSHIELQLLDLELALTAYQPDEMNADLLADWRDRQE